MPGCELDCELDCDASCRTELKGTCEASCTGVDAALFCDGQYVDTGNNLQNCLDALKATLKLPHYVIGEIVPGEPRVTYRT
jgi:hypothetical protein